MGILHRGKRWGFQGHLRKTGDYSIHFRKFAVGVVREVNARVLGKGLELLSVTGGRFEINQLLLADDTALMADSKEKLCRLVGEFGRV